MCRWKVQTSFWNVQNFIVITNARFTPLQCFQMLWFLMTTSRVKTNLNEMQHVTECQMGVNFRETKQH